MGNDFDPADLNDQESVAQAIRDLPPATAEEIAERFDHTSDAWKQGDRPAYVQPDDLDERLQMLLADACLTVEEKTTTDGGPFTDPDGTVWWSPDLSKPFYGASWSYGTFEDEKYCRIDLVLDKGPNGTGWVPFVFMRRSDDVVAFWFHDSIGVARTEVLATAAHGRRLRCLVHLRSTSSRPSRPPTSLGLFAEEYDRQRKGWWVTSRRRSPVWF